MAPGRRVVRLGIPALLVAGLAAVALWRIGPPADDHRPVGTAGTADVKPQAGPLTTIADIVTRNAVGREASLESVEIREITSGRSFWVGPIKERPVFAVLDANVTRDPGVRLAAGQRVTLVGRVRPAPTLDEAVSQWGIDRSIAKSVEELGTYLQVTRVSN